MDEVRMMFNVEQAHWFYVDFERPNQPSLPNYNLRDFSFACEDTFQPLLLLISHALQWWMLLFLWRNLCLVLMKYSHHLWSIASVYQSLVQSSSIPRLIRFAFLDPTRHRAEFCCLGWVLQLVLVKGSAKSWSFPKGKINENESEPACCIREVVILLSTVRWQLISTIFALQVEEETGYSINPSGFHKTGTLSASIHGQQLKMFLLSHSLNLSGLIGRPMVSCEQFPNQFRWPTHSSHHRPNQCTVNCHPFHCVSLNRSPPFSWLDAMICPLDLSRNGLQRGKIRWSLIHGLTSLSTELIFVVTLQSDSPCRREILLVEDDLSKHTEFPLVVLYNTVVSLDKKGVCMNCFIFWINHESKSGSIENSISPGCMSS